MQPKLHRSISDWLEKADHLIDRFAPAAAIILLLLFGIWAWSASHHVKFQFDELLEMAAATAPSNHDVLAFLASGVDFNPPLSHFLIRASVAVFGESEWAARLPAFAGILTLLLCIYVYVAKRLRRSYGLIAILLILGLPVRLYAIQARPYGLVLGISGLVLLLYQAAQGKRRLFVLPCLMLCTAALAASHYYAVLVVGVLIAAELSRSWMQKRIDWLLLCSCALPPIAVLFVLRNAIHEQRMVLTHYFARGNLLSFKHGYDELLMDPLVLSIALLLVVGLLLLRLPRTDDQAPLLLSMHEWTFAIGLLLLPILGAFVTQFVTHAYVPRYFLPAAIGFSICACCMIRSLSQVLPSITVILVVSLTIGLGKVALQEVPHQSDDLPLASDLAVENTPILFDTPGTYEEAYYYLPSLRKNMWVIAEPAASLRYRQYDTDDKIMLALAQHGHAQAVSIREAVQRWTDFRLVPRSADYVWALKCFMETGSQIEVRHPFGNSNFVFNVHVKPGSLSDIEACAVQ